MKPHSSRRLPPGCLWPARRFKFRRRTVLCLIEARAVAAKQMFGLRLASARMTEMGIAEACCVFEPVAECAISPNMNDPDRADRKEEHIGE